MTHLKITALDRIYKFRGFDRRLHLDLSLGGGEEKQKFADARTDCGRSHFKRFLMNEICSLPFCDRSFLFFGIDFPRGRSGFPCGFEWNAISWIDGFIRWHNSCGRLIARSGLAAAGHFNLSDFPGGGKWLKHCSAVCFQWKNSLSFAAFRRRIQHYTMSTFPVQ